MRIGYFKDAYEKIETVNATTNRVFVKKDKKGTSFIVVAVSKDKTSLPSTVLIETTPSTVSIPGRIQPTDFLVTHNVPLVYWPEEDDKPEDYYFFKTNSSFENKQVSISYQTKVTKSGWYRFNYRGRSFHKGKFFDLWIDNRLAATIDFDPDRNDRVSKKHKVYLEKGTHELEITILKEEFDRWALGWIEFSEIQK